MYVTSSKRGIGAGKALLIAAINKAMDLAEVEQINLNVTASNQIAKQLYAKLGFTEFGLEKKSLKVNEKYYDDAYLVLHLKEVKEGEK
jgi:RimJ/RimL family protein N-acetyltransferase